MLALRARLRAMGGLSREFWERIEARATPLLLIEGFDHAACAAACAAAEQVEADEAQAAEAEARAKAEAEARDLEAANEVERAEAAKLAEHAREKARAAEYELAMRDAGLGPLARASARFGRWRTRQETALK